MTASESSKYAQDKADERRGEVARLSLQGWSQSAMAKHFGVVESTISRDLVIVRQRWKQSAVRDFDLAKSVEIAKIDLVEKEYWEAWNRSKTIKETTTIEETDSEKGGRTIVKREVIFGTAAYLEGVRGCIGDRCKLLGFDTELKYADLNAALQRVGNAGYAIEEDDDDSNAIEAEADPGSLTP